MIPHFPNLSNLLSDVSNVFKEWVLGESPEMDKINAIFKEVEEMRLDLDEELKLASHVSKQVPEVADEVTEVAATKLSILQAQPKLPVVESPRSQETHLEWKKLNNCLNRVDRMQKMLDKLIEKFGKFPSTEQVDEVKAMLDQLKSTQLLAGIREDLASLTVLTEREAIPGLEQETLRVLDEIEAITNEAEKLEDEIKAVKPEREEDKVKVEKLVQSLSKIIDSGAKELEKAVDADIESNESDAKRLQSTLESYQKIKKDLKEKVEDTRSKFTDYLEGVESRKRMEAAKKQFEDIKNRKADSSGIKRPIKRLDRQKAENMPATKAQKVAPGVLKVRQQQEKDQKIVNRFVDFILSEKENRAIEPKKLEEKFLAWSKQNPDTLHPAIAKAFFKANSSKINEELVNKPKA